MILLSVLCAFLAATFDSVRIFQTSNEAGDAASRALSIVQEPFLALSIFIRYLFFLEYATRSPDHTGDPQFVSYDGAQVRLEWNATAGCSFQEGEAPPESQPEQGGGEKGVHCERESVERGEALLEIDGQQAQAVALAPGQA